MQPCGYPVKISWCAASKGGFLGSNGRASLTYGAYGLLKNCIPDNDRGFPIGIAAGTPVRAPPFNTLTMVEYFSTHGYYRATRARYSDR
jgi:hypothetical protein